MEKVIAFVAVLAVMVTMATSYGYWDSGLKRIIHTFDVGHALLAGTASLIPATLLSAWFLQHPTSIVGVATVIVFVCAIVIYYVCYAIKQDKVLRSYLSRYGMKA